MAIPKRKAKDSPRNRTGCPVNVWIDDRVAGALAEYCEKSFPRIKKNAVVEAAIIEYLQRQGVEFAEGGGAPLRVSGSA